MKLATALTTQGQRPDVNLRSAVRLALCVLLATALLSSFSGMATANSGVYLSQDDFLAETYPKGVPETKVIWVAGELKEDIAEALGHDYGRLRVRYWEDGERTTWVLEELGKEEMITVGITVRYGIIEKLRILIYREDRGWEVRLPFFTKQFFGIALNEENSLTGNVDGISGATMSVNSVKALAKVAILLDQQVQAENADG